MRRWAAALLLAAAPLAWPQEGEEPPPAFYREQAARARAALDALPGRPQMLERIRALSSAAPLVSQLKTVGKRIFYMKLASREGTSVLYMREGLGGAERAIVDPARLSAGGAQAAIDEYAPSPDGKVVAYGVSTGSGDSVLRVLAVDGLRDLGVRIDRALPGAQIAWHPDGRSFYYPRVAADGQQSHRFSNVRIYRHQLGRDAARDEIVFAPGVGGARDVPEFAAPSLHIPRETRHAYAIARDGVRREIAVHVTDLADLARARPQWRKVAGYDDGVVAIEAWKDDLLLLTHQGAPNFRVVRMKPAAPLASARVVVSEGDAVIEQMALAKDAIYLRSAVGGIDRLEKTPTGLFGSHARQFVKVPFDNAISELIADPRVPGVLLRLQGWIEPPAIVQVDPKGELKPTALQPAPAVSFAGMDEVRLYAKSHDGTSIPVTLVYKKTTTLTGRNPTLLVAFGSYGVTLPPTYDPGLLAWLERGGVWAIAHVRGGGEHGIAWHLAGMRAQKINTILDFIAVAEFVSSYGFTSPSKLAAVGSGAGAIPVAGAMVRRPELFAAVVLRAPMTDMLRLEFTPNGPANIPEFGTSTTPEGNAALRAISPLHHVKDATAYPAVLITASQDDPWIALSQPGKFAARLLAANAGPRPILLRIDDATTRVRHDADLADIYSFVLHEFDRPPVPAAPPPPAPSPPAPEPEAATK